MKKLATIAMICCTSAAWAVDTSTRLDITLPVVTWTSDGYAATYAGAPSDVATLVTHSGPATGPTDVVGYSRSVDYAPDFDAWALGEVGNGFLGAYAHVDDGVQLDAVAGAGWMRDFSLNPGASFSFSALVAISDSVMGYGWNNAYAFQSLTQGSSPTPLDIWVAGLGFEPMKAEMWATLPVSACADCVEVSSELLDPSNASFYINVANRTDHVLTGTLGANAFAVAYSEEISAPVPEPETWAMMFAGLGLIGAAAKRRA